jgi:hypothetical protein
LSDQIKIKISSFEYFSIACDEKVPITAQLAMFFCASLMEINFFEELFVSVHELLKKYELPLVKLSSVTTDGAPSMMGKNKGFIERLRKKVNENFEDTFHRTYCIIHQGVLCTKVINMAHEMKPLKQMVNFIRLFLVI